jgi:spore germination protein KC
MKAKLILILTLILCLTGCYNYNELNTLAIATGMAIDYEDGEYVVNLLIANSQKAQVSSKEGEAQSIVYEGKGKTLSEAIKEVDIISPKNVYIGHLSFIVISESLAKEGIVDSLDYLLRNPESIKRFYLVMAKGTEAKNIVSLISPLESFPAQSISTSISFSKESQAVSSAIPYSTFVDKYLKKGVEPILPTILLEGDAEEGKSEDTLKQTTPTAYVKLSNLAMFKKDKLIHITNEEESDGINIIENDVSEMLVVINCSGGKMAIELRDLKSTKKVSLKNNTPKITLNIHTKASIQENNCQLDLEDEKTILETEEKVKEEIERLMDKAITVAKTYQTDIFGFGNLTYKYHPSYFNSVKDTWNEQIFPQLTIEKKVNVDLESKGSIESSIKEG